MKLETVLATSLGWFLGLCLLLTILGMTVKVVPR